MYRKELVLVKSFQFFGALFITLSIILTSIIPAYYAPKYIIFLIPIFIMISSDVIVKILRFNRILAILVILLLIFSNILFIVPINLIKYTRYSVPDDRNCQKQVILERTTEPYSYLYYFIYELFTKYQSPEDKIMNVIKSRAGQRKTLYGEFGMMTFDYYLNITPDYYPNLSSSSIDLLPDVIVTRKPKFNNSGYERTDIDANYCDKFIGDSSPLHRQFVEDKSGHVFVYIKKNI